MIDLDFAIAELARKIANIVRVGTVAEIHPQDPLVRVQIGGLLTGWLRWLSHRAGQTRTWDPPTEGEQVIVFSPSGDPAAGYVLSAIYSDSNPPPVTSHDQHYTRYPDGAIVFYDHAQHLLYAELPAGGRAELRAPSGLKVIGDVEIVGKLDATQKITSAEDVFAQTISLKTHKHTGVMSGPALTGTPV